MSLIHDALKKAQAEAYTKGETPKVEDPSPSQGVLLDETKLPFPKRTLFLAGLLAVAIFVALYLRLAGDEGTKVADPSSGGSTAHLGQKVEEAKNLTEQAIDAYHANDLNTAWAKFSLASQLDPQNAEIWNDLGVVSRRRGDMTKAKEAFLKALVLRPDYPECLNNLAVLHVKNKETEKAKGYLAKALALRPSYAEALFHFAIITEREGKKEEAVALYKRFLEAGSGMPAHLLEQVRDHLLGMTP